MEIRVDGLEEWVDVKVGWMDGNRDGWINGWMEGRKEIRMDG